MRRKYIFFDIDGTLLVGIPGRQYIPDSARVAIQRLKEAGHFVCIATGRAQCMAVDVMHELGFCNMVSDGGYALTINDELLGIRPLDHEACVRLIDECAEKGFPWTLQLDNSTTRVAPDDSFVKATNDVFMDTRVVPGLDPRDHDTIYKMYIACYAPHEQELEALVDLPWCRYHEEYFFVEPTYKAEGIRAMVDHEGGSYEDVVVFGDGLNDLTMFLPEWTSVAMGNGAPELKARATYVTAPAAEDGIYKACEHLGLFETVQI